MQVRRNEQNLFQLLLFWLGSVYCVRWSADGRLLATSAGDDSVKIIDFGTGKEIYRAYTSDSSKELQNPFVLTVMGICRTGIFSMLHGQN